MTRRPLIARFLSSLLKKAAVLVLSFAIGLSQLQMAFASSPGTTTAELLKIPAGARAVGMGEAYTGLADDTSALQWNPAGLSLMTQKEASFMHTSLIEGIHYETLAYASPGDIYSFGGSMSYLGYGTISGYNDLGASIGDQNAYSGMITGGMSTKIMDRWTGGVTLSGIREELASDSADTFAFNLGTLYSLAAKPLDAEYRFGFSALNLGPGLKFVSERDSLPQRYNFGAAILHVKNWPINFTTDVSIPNDNVPYIDFGSEYWFRDLLALRLGYSGANDVGKGLRVGVGMQIHGIAFDYAYGGFGDFGATQRVELSMHFGEKMHQLNKEERSILKDAKLSTKNGDYVQAILDMDGIMEKDPDNQKILKQMIDTHEAMLRKELNDTVAQNGDQQIPSPEEFALQDLVPGQQTLVQGPGGMAAVGTVGAAAHVGEAAQVGNDPLGLDTLPDVEHLDNNTVPAPDTNTGSSAPDADTIGQTKPILTDTPITPAPHAAKEPTVTNDSSAPALTPKKSTASEARKPSSSDLVPQTDNTPSGANAEMTNTPTPDYTVPAPVPNAVPVAEPATVPAPDNTPSASGAAPSAAPTPDNTSSSDNTLVNPSDIYGK